MTGTGRPPSNATPSTVIFCEVCDDWTLYQWGTYVGEYPNGRWICEDELEYDDDGHNSTLNRYMDTGTNRGGDE